MSETDYKAPEYRSRTIETPLQQQAPSQQMPSKIDTSEWDIDGQQGISLKVITLVLGALTVTGFMVFDAIDSLVTQFSEYPLISTGLGVLLGGFVTALIALIVKEWRGFRAVEACIETPLNLPALAKLDDRAGAEKRIRAHAQRFGKDSYAARCYKQYQTALHADMTAADVSGLYESMVAVPVTKKAEEILRKEAVVSGSLAFISPNHLIQTLAIAWISFRTIRRIARVFGLRPGTAGSWRLFKVLAQNLAAQSLFDMATDELANQISGSLAAKVVENSAEAVAAGALNVRLGRTLIKLLR
ncbi:DUF697 domain-containing protein [Alteromonas sp. NFXS44]|uniref:YcjF family protein n=1 Tax=Alteromonas sp. NFXS44 TaxID=2818435 RepID=UPI0032DF4B72